MRLRCSISPQVALISYLCNPMPLSKKKNIRDCSAEEITVFFKDQGEKAFRSKQVYEWLWQKSVQSFEEMTNLPKSSREKLSGQFELLPARILKTQKSSDGTVKNAFRLHDGNIIEGVLIPAEDRVTACVSSQVGCSLTCKFCATGMMERVRNLDAGEIYDQVVHLRNQSEQFYNTPLTNIVYMGMGEPLLNYSEVLRSVDRITATDGLNMSSQRITVSTAGIAKMIKKLGDDEVKFNLALSLHAANDRKRSEIMPINEQNSLEVLGEALKYFNRKTGTRVTYEYIVFKGFNDSPEDAQELALFCRIVPCKVNIIEYNPVEGTGFTNARADKIEHFKKILEQKKIIVNIRRSRGKDIDAACGQLANKSVPSEN